MIEGDFLSLNLSRLLHARPVGAEGLAHAIQSEEKVYILRTSSNHSRIPDGIGEYAHPTWIALDRLAHRPRNLE